MNATVCIDQHLDILGIDEVTGVIIEIIIDCSGDTRNRAPVTIVA